jgi:hypothetical protein
MLSVDLGLGLVNPKTFPTAKVSVRYFSDALGRMLQEEFVLSESSPTATWNEVIHEVPTKGYEYKLDWLRSDGDVLHGAWTPTTSTRLRLDAPVSDKLDVVVLCTGNFTDPQDKIAQVGVALRYRDAANNYTEEGHLVFTSETQQLPWTVDLRDSQHREYEYRYSIVYAGGLVKEYPDDGTWFTGEPGFVTVGERYTLAVDIYPTLQSFPDHAKLVQVDLTYLDQPHGIEQHDAFVFSPTANAVRTWRVRGLPDGPKTYSCTVSYFAADGSVTTTPPVTRDAEALVVPPPPKPLPPVPATPVAPAPPVAGPAGPVAPAPTPTPFPGPVAPAPTPFPGPVAPAPTPFPGPVAPAPTPVAPQPVPASPVAGLPLQPVAGQPVPPVTPGG